MARYAPAQVSRLDTAFALGLHGCDRTVGEQALAGDLDLSHSGQEHDWLGPRVYFWQGDPVRAMQWATAPAKRVAGRVPYVIGAAVDLGNCFDLTLGQQVELLRDAPNGLVAALQAQDKPMPQNRNAAIDTNRDALLRNLDCAVIRCRHDSIEQELEVRSTHRALQNASTQYVAFSGKAHPSIPQAAFKSARTRKSRFEPLNASKAPSSRAGKVYRTSHRAPSRRCTAASRVDRSR